MLIARVPRREPEPMLELGSSRVGHRFALRLTGELDLAGVPALLDSAGGGFAAGIQEVWLDLTELEFIDVRGVHALLDLHRRACGEGRRFSVICPPGSVSRAFDLTGAAAELALYPSRSEAHRLA